MQTALSYAVDRLEAVIIRENEALTLGTRVDLSETAGRKNQSLLELSRLTRGLQPEALDNDERVRLAHLRAKLDDNQNLLARHVKASHDISTVIARSIEEAESDGTYTSRPEFAGRVR